MNKSNLLNQVRQLLGDNRPHWITFREQTEKPGYYMHHGKLLSREDCLKLPSRMHIFVKRKLVVNE